MRSSPNRKDTNRKQFSDHPSRVRAVASLNSQVCLGAYHSQRRYTGLGSFRGSPGPVRHDLRPDPAAWAKVALHHGPFRLSRFHHIIKYLIDDVLLKDTEVAIC